MLCLKGSKDSKGFNQGVGVTRCTLFRPREATGDWVGETADWVGAIVGSSETHGAPGGRQDIGLREHICASNQVSSFEGGTMALVTGALQDP